MENYYKFIGSKLHQIACLRHGGMESEISLILAIMLQAGKDLTSVKSSAEDIKSASIYLDGQNFIQDCQLIGLEHAPTRLLLRSPPPKNWDCV